MKIKSRKSWNADFIYSWKSLVENGKWKINLVWYIYNGIKRPGELHRRIPRASRRLLDTQLSQLLAHGIIDKTVFQQKPAKVEYELTDLGKSLIPIIEVTAMWGKTNRDILEPLILQTDAVQTL